MARLREAQEHPQWHSEIERRSRIRNRIDSLRPRPLRKSLVPVDAALLTIHCDDMQDLLRQLVLLAQAADRSYEALRKRVEVPLPRRPAVADFISRGENSAQSV